MCNEEQVNNKASCDSRLMRLGLVCSLTDPNCLEWLTKEKNRQRREGKGERRREEGKEEEGRDGRR